MQSEFPCVDLRRRYGCFFASFQNFGHTLYVRVYVHTKNNYIYGRNLNDTSTVQYYSLNGQCHDIFDTFLTKKSTQAPYKNKQKCLFFLESFRFRKAICEKRVSASSATCRHCVSVVNDYTQTRVNVVNHYMDIVSAQSTTMSPDTREIILLQKK